jgi:hypothetical protein
MIRFFFLVIFSVTFCNGYYINATDKAELYTAFATVFNVKDNIELNNDIILQKAMLELAKMGVSENITELCTMETKYLYNILMKAALGEYIFSLQDPNDWILTIDNVQTGQLIRKRSFSATRFAILETLLIITIVALGRVLWIK